MALEAPTDESSLHVRARSTRQRRDRPHIVFNRTTGKHDNFANMTRVANRIVGTPLSLHIQYVVRVVNYFTCHGPRSKKCTIQLTLEMPPFADKIPPSPLTCSPMLPPRDRPCTPGSTGLRHRELIGWTVIATNTRRGWSEGISIHRARFWTLLVCFIAYLD